MVNQIEKYLRFIPPVLIEVNHKKINEYLATLFVFIFLVFQPLVKYNENVYQGYRFNITIINIFLLLMIIGNSLFMLRSFNYRKTPLIAIIFIQILFVQIVSYIWIQDYSLHATEIYLKTISKSIFAASLWFIAGAYIETIFSDTTYRRALRISWIFLSFFFLYNSILNAFRFSIDLGDNLIYLMLADTYAVVSIFAVHATRTRWARHLIFIFSIVTLFALLSRTSLYFFVIIYILYMFRENRRVLVFMMLGSFVLLINASSEIKEGRMLAMVFGANDRSATMRYDMLMDGLNSLKANWVTGQFMGDINEYAGTEGYYIHNFISIWRQYGLIPFILILGTIINNQFKLGMRWAKGNKLEIHDKFLFYFTMFIIFELAFARTFDHPYIWLTFIPAYKFINRRDKLKV